MTKAIIKPSLAANYEAERAKGALCFPYYAQPKIDGVRVLVTLSEGEVVLYSRNGNKLSLPHLSAALTPYLTSRPGLILDGELYSRDLSFTALCSAIRSSEHHDKQMVSLYLFDCYNPNRPRQAYKDRYKALYDLSGVPFIEVVESLTVKSHRAVERALEHFIGLGYEGVMIKSISSPYKQGRSKAMMKYKKFLDSEFEVVATDATTITCYTPSGVPFSVKGRAKLGEIVTIRYQEITPNGSLRFPRLVASRDYE